jgi:glycyl-tRNA synthetase beta chain
VDTLTAGTEEQVLAYMIERFRAWYEEESIPAEVFKAVSARGLSRPLDIHRRVQAVHSFSKLPESQALAAANKRVSNILGKLDSTHSFGEVSPDLLVEPQEKSLDSHIEALSAICNAHLERGEYTEALTCLAGLREPIDAFFDDVMVNVDADDLRHNRLNLLKQLRDLFLQVADISLLVVNK